MTGVDYKREQWLSAQEEPEGNSTEMQNDIYEVRPDRSRGVILIVCTLLAFGWIVVSALSLVIAPKTDLPAVAAWIAAACSPLALIALLYICAARTSMREGTRLARVSAGLRAEQARLDAALAHTTEQVAIERISIGEHAGQLLMIGDDAANRLRMIGDGLRQDVEVLAHEANEIATASAQARSDLAIITQGLPKVRSEIDSLIASIDIVGLRSHERAGALDAVVIALASRAREVDDVAGGAAQRLSAHLARVEGTSAAATGAIVAATGTMTTAIDETLAYATRAADSVRDVTARQSEAMLAIVAQGDAALAKTGSEAGTLLRERVDAVVQQMTQLGAVLEERQRFADQTITDVSVGIDRLDERFTTFSDRANERGEQIDASLGRLAGRSDALTQVFEQSVTTADTLIERAETLITAIDATTREIDETLPAALARLDQTTQTSLGTLDDVRPHVEHFAQEASDALDRLLHADSILQKQQTGLSALSAAGGTELIAAHEAAAALLTTIERAKHETAETVRGVNIDLLDALGNAGTSTRQAVDDARGALASIAPDVADQLGQSVRAALQQSVDDEVAARVEALGQTAERAVAAANQASDRLMRQMLTIAETSAQVEARMGEVRSEAEDVDRDDFSRRVALLIESLNSTAIDVSKILSNDVSDAAWAAYLKGDRGVFTRRAVRLLDTAEVREIARHYGDDPEFREQVNRYIHDFEAMLRNVLATRNGSPLGVTLLSSDMGKLYVALAQAIERLRA